MKNQFKRNGWFYEWNKKENRNPTHTHPVKINDETLRDGIQSSGIRYPGLKDKIKILEAMHELGIDAACIGFPAAGPAMMRDIEGMIRCVRENRFTLEIACAARTVPADIVPIARLSQEFGISIDANIFVGSSPIRQFVEGWNLDYILKLVEGSLACARENGIPVCFITEDTTRSKPGDLERIYRAAVEQGAYRVCLCDTVGYATPQGTGNLVTFIKTLLKKIGREDILVDWHGHNDRGLGLANALAALASGVDRIHATALGIGERTGNTSMEQLLINLKLMGLRELDLVKLKHYCLTVAGSCRVKIPPHFPILGGKAFATAAGVHAAAIMKAKKMGNNWLADRVYSSIPAEELGFQQKIEIGPMSGKSNVRYFLEQNNIYDEEMVDEIFAEIRRRMSGDAH